MSMLNWDNPRNFNGMLTNDMVNFEQLAPVFQILDGDFASQVSHEVDGLIFQPVPDVSFCEKILKHVLRFRY